MHATDDLNDDTKENLIQLLNMGFTDYDLNLRQLIKTQNNLEMAINLLCQV